MLSVIATMSIMVEDIVENETPVVPPPTPGPPPVPGTAEASFGLDTTDVAPAASADSVPQGKTGSSAWITGALVVVAMLLAGILLTQNDTPSAPQESGQPAPQASDGNETIGEHHATLAAALERLDEPATPTACKTSDPALAKTLVRAAALLESGEPIAAVTVLETHSGGTDLSAERWSLMARARLAHSVKVSRTIPGKSSDAKSCETALENAARASELCPAMAAPHMTRGRVHAHRATLTEIPQATAAYEEAIARLGGQPVYKAAALFNQSQLWIRSDPKRAEKRLDELLTLLPDYKGARWLRGEAKLGRARLAKEPKRAELARSAVTDLEQAKAKHPGEAGVLFLLGTGQELAGERDRARGSFCELAELGTDRIHVGAKKKCASLSLKSP